MTKQFMTKQLLTKTLTLVFSTLLLFNLTNAQQPKTVTDFYLALPKDRYSSPLGRKISGPAAIEKYRKSLITIEDISNGYLKLEQNESEGWSEFALFKKSDGTYLFAVSEISCAPGCGGELQFLTFNNGKWIDVTKHFFPELSTEVDFEKYETYWELPRVGKTLKFIETNEDVRDQSEKLVHIDFKFEWNGSRFVGK